MEEKGGERGTWASTALAGRYAQTMGPSWQWRIDNELLRSRGGGAKAIERNDGAGRIKWSKLVK